MTRINRVAQWAFDTKPILGRFHLWLEDVDMEVENRDKSKSADRSISFVDERMERLFIMTAAVTAFGTKLFGRYGEGRDLAKKELNQVKKDADAISAYALSESLWYLSRLLPENHAIMVCVGEGLMPKAGETPEMGSNPMLGFGRIYARPQVAKYLDRRVHKLINDDSYNWPEFKKDINTAGITIWGTAIDTLENTTRFAKGEETGPLTVLHVFDQPLWITKPYEGYIGNIILPKEIVENAEGESVLINFFTPREKIVHAIKNTYPDIKNENIHVWTLAGKSRVHRIGKLWEEWRSLGVHIVEEGWALPTGFNAFTDSGTYAPTALIGTWQDEKSGRHLFLIDGYAASAEALQASSLCPILNIDASLAVFTSKFQLSYENEAMIMHLDPDAPDFKKKLSAVFEDDLGDDTVEMFRSDIKIAADAGINLEKQTISVDDFLPEKRWSVMAISGYMLPDPYSGSPGVRQISDDTYEVTVSLLTPGGSKKTTLKLRLEEPFEESRLVFNPLLNRFMKGENFRKRAVKISDSGRIRNELQTLCSEALEHFGSNGMKVHFNKISEDVISLKNQKLLREILSWYKENHPIWFSWLELAD
ncbi:hypothetical protein J7K93_04645 [bacterium]|nr:hypothetical protein [bacterium]